MDTTLNTDDSSALFLWASITIHGILWCGSLVLLAWYVMPWASVFNDFGVELSEGAIWVIALTDWIYGFWFIVLPLIVAIAAGADFVAFAMTRSTLLRGLWVAIACLIPLILTGTMFVTIGRVFAQLHQDLN